MTAPDLPTWRKSRRSGGEGGNCIELSSEMNAVRDSKNPGGPTLRADLRTLLAAAKSGQLDAR
jgi:hypothetical protein